MHGALISSDTIDATESLRAAIHAIIAIMHVAHDLLKSNRPIDLAGLDSQVGLVCAKALDLPTEFGRMICPDLMTLLHETEMLSGALAMSVG